AFFADNCVATFNLLEDARHHKVERFIQLSTSEVYGHRRSGYHDETSSLNPCSAYAATKAAADMLLESYYKTHKFPGIVVRTSDVYGAWQSSQKVIPTFVRHAISDVALPIFGDGSQKKAWIAVED